MESKIIECLYCGKKTRTKINENTILLNFPLFCPKCKKEIIINAKQMNISVAEDLSDAKTQNK